MVRFQNFNCSVNVHCEMFISVVCLCIDDSGSLCTWGNTECIQIADC